MNNETMVFDRSDRTGRWIKGRDRSGLVGSVSWDELERILRHVRRLGENETINQVKVGRNGVSFVIDKIVERL